jgi:predicted amidohydrolase YtcJ
VAARITAFLVAFIVGVSVVAGLIVGAQREADPAIDLLIYNGRVYTGDPEAPLAEAVAIRGNRIVKVGTNREVKRLHRNAATVVDAHGGSILPGFADTYVALPGDADAIAGAHRLGLTAVGAIVPDVAALDTLNMLAGAGDHPMRVAAALKVSLPLAEPERQTLAARRTQSASSLVRLDALAYDVAVVATKPVRSARGRTEPVAPTLANDQQQALVALDREGWPLVLHVDDERELEAALDVVARLIETNATPASPRRHRLALAHPMPLDTARLATLGLTVAMPLPATWTGVAVDPAVVTAEAAGAGATTDATVPPPSTLPFSFPLPEGVRLVMGSEIVADPRLGLQALVSSVAPVAAARGAGQTDTTAPAAPAVEREADAPVDRAVVTAALATLTSGAAHTLGGGAEWGTIEPGRLADLVVLSADLLELPAARLLDAVVTATVVDGKVVYDRETDTPPTP